MRHVLRAGQYEVLFESDKGMNFTKFKKGNLDIIDPLTRPLFEERYAGLGALIGPHFHHRKIVPPVANPSLFPHIALLEARGVKEPFSHGIGRYAPWKVVQATACTIHATLEGGMLWNNVPLALLEGQDFQMDYRAELSDQGLHIDLRVSSERESVVGLHTYYALSGRSKVEAKIHNYYRESSTLLPIPPEWNYKEDHTFIFEVNKSADYGFFPFPGPLEGKIFLETATHRVSVGYKSENKENSWQLWYPKKNMDDSPSFICIEPLSAADPLKPKLKTSSLKIDISVT